MKIQFLSSLAIATIFISSCSDVGSAKEESETTDTTETTSNAPSGGIQPPIEGVNVPFMNQTMSAEEGGAFVYETGSIVTFPSNAVLHADGSPVIGDIDVSYREFQDPLDIYFSGIPMSYDSMETTYNFISAGMCELKASQNGEDLIVNPDANPTVDLVSRDADPAHNLYYFDEDRGMWLPKGKPSIDEFKEEAEEPTVGETLPLKPQKINHEKYSFFISVEDLGGEFQGFDDMHFQIADEEKNYNPNDAKIQWYSVDVKKSKKLKGKYMVTFANATTSRTYITDPVFTDEEYDKAMATYNKVMEEKAEELKKIEAERAAWEKEQALIIAQNEIIDSINEANKVRNAAIQADWEAYEAAQQKSNEAFMSAAFQQGTYSITRGISVDGFGVWNCDNPAFKKGFLATSIDFENIIGNSAVKNDEINFSVIYKDENSVYANNFLTYKNLPNTLEVIFFVNGKSLYYGTNKEDQEVANMKFSEMDVSNISYKELKKKLIGS